MPGGRFASSGTSAFGFDYVLNVAVGISAGIGALISALSALQPRLCRAVAEDGYLPRAFNNQKRRLVYSEGIWLLAILSGVPLLVFDGVTDWLIPLFVGGDFWLQTTPFFLNWKMQLDKATRGHPFD